MQRKSQWFLMSLLSCIFFLLIGCFLPSPDMTNHVLQGRIMIPDSTSKDISGWIPLANATVTITDSEGIIHTVTTNSDGYYFFPGLAPGENYVITATGHVDDITVILKDIIPLVEEGKSYDAGTADCQSTALALAVEALLSEGLTSEEINLQEIQNTSHFEKLISSVCLALEEYEDVTANPDVLEKIADIVDEIIPEPEPSAPNLSSDASLSDLTINGTTITGFSPIVFIYTLDLPYDTAGVPLVDATVNDSDASKVITQASALTGTENERTATVVVTAEDGVTENTYTVTFSLLGPVNNITQGTYYDTIQEAFNVANTGDIIEASDGTYQESITYPSGKVIILQSKNGASATVIQGTNNLNTITCNGSVNGNTLEGFTVTHENTKTGRGIENNGTLTINNCTICENNNSNSNFGGGIRNDGTLTINDTTICDNITSTNYGGGIYNDGTLMITDSTISGNSISGFGGGGGIYNDNSGSLTISNSTVDGNSAQSISGGYGGGIQNRGILTIEESTVCGNEVTYNGGGIYNQGTLTIDTGSILSDNTADYGGGVFNTDSGTCILEGVSTITYNAVTSYGGGIYNNTSCTVTVAGASMISDNSATGTGGGIYNKGTLNINELSIVSNNRASYGGGICQDSADAETIISSSVIYNNTGASLGGGGIYQGNGTLIVTSSTISSNKLLYGGTGGGIYISAGSATIGGNDEFDTDNFNVPLL